VAGATERVAAFGKPAMRRGGFALAALGAIALTGCGSSHSGGSGHSGGSPSSATTTAGTGGPTQSGGGKMGPEGILVERGPSLAPASTTTQGTTVNGIHCGATEQVAYHIHSHLQVYVNGSPRQLPGGIGIVGPVVQKTRYGPFFEAAGCYYWLHTHTADGIIHVESPTPRIYTLGDFFDEWRQPLSASTVATARGPVTAFFNGKRWTKSPRDIPLVAHGVIQLDVGRPVVGPKPVSFAGSGL
jgi:hypothetical protein